ncbi:MAG: hypothetical protein Q7S21_01135 [archaeon]|nr:hypothetical protein [archaeon]
MPVRRIRPTLKSEFFSHELSEQAGKEFELLEERLLAATKEERVRGFVEPMHALSPMNLERIISQMPALVKRISELEKPHQREFHSMAFDAVRKVFGAQIPEFFNEFKTIPLEPAKLEPAIRLNPERAAKLTELADRLRMQSFLGHGVAFFLQEKMLTKFKPQIDAINPSLFPMYKLLNSYNRYSFYYFLERPTIAAASQLGEGKTRLEFTEMRDRKGNVFFVPKPIAEVSAVCFPALLHEVAESSANIASRDIFDKALRNLPANERQFVFNQLHTPIAEIHSYVFGPIAFNALRKVFSRFARYPISKLSLREEKTSYRLLRSAFPEASQKEAQTIVGVWVDFLKLPKHLQNHFLQQALIAKTPIQQQRIAQELRLTLLETIKKKRK